MAGRGRALGGHGRSRQVTAGHGRALGGDGSPEVESDHVGSRTRGQSGAGQVTGDAGIASLLVVRNAIR